MRILRVFQSRISGVNASCLQFTYEVKSTGLEIVKKFYLVKNPIF